MEKIKVLVIDSGAGYAKTVTGRPHKHIFEIQKLLHGRQAVVLVTNQVPDVIVMDLKTPGIYGLELLRHIKQTKPDIQVIILSGQLSGVDKMAAYFYGAWAILEKSVTADSLFETILSAYRSGHGWPDANAGRFPSKPGKRQPLTQ